VLGILILLVGGFVALAKAPFLRIGSVEVSGVRTTATSSVEQLIKDHLAGSYLYLIPKNNIFLYPNEESVEALRAAYPQFKSVEIHAADFNTLAATIVERQPTALWCETVATTTQVAVRAEAPVQGQCYLMDEDGVVYAPAGASTTYAFVSYDGAVSSLGPRSGGARQYITPEQYRSLSALVGAISQSEPSDIVRQVAVDSDGDALAYFSDGFLLLFNLSDETGDVYERFSLALKSDPFKDKPLSSFEYLDLRFGDKLYYKSK